MNRKRIEWEVISALALVALAFLALALPSRGRQIRSAPAVPWDVADPRFARAMGTLFGPALLAGNKVTALQNGDETFPAMLTAIAGAKTSITFETAYFRKGELTRRFAAALAEKARAGVPVHVILDWAGTEKLHRAEIDTMRNAGAEVEIYHKPHLYRPRDSQNRSHRRIMVMDGRVAFTGGICVADDWLGHAQDAKHWRDTQYEIEGPVVAQLQTDFMDHWRESHGVLLTGDGYFPKLDSAGAELAQSIISSPREGSENIRVAYLMLIGGARHGLLIENPYFVPDDVLVGAIVAARRRGVDITIIVPGPVMDAKTTALASRSRWEPLLATGVRIFRYQPTMLHQKVMIADGLWVTTGSANFDNRSFRLNDEINLNVDDSSFARVMTDAFRRDLAASAEVTLAQYQHRGIPERIGEAIASVIRAQL